MIFARKNYKIPEFYMIFARKMPEFYVIIARKIFFPNFRGHGPPDPRLLCLWSFGLNNKWLRWMWFGTDLRPVGLVHQRWVPACVLFYFRQINGHC